MLVQLQQAVLSRHDVRASSRMLAADSEHATHVLDCGEGPPLLLLHGGGANSAEWSPLLARLQDDFRCVAVDRPGHGMSHMVDYRRVDNLRAHAAAFVERTLDLLQLRSATLVGNSMGGFFALAFALQHPERVDGVAFVGAPAGIDRFIPAKLRALSLPLLGPLLWKTVARPTHSGMRAFYADLLMHDGSKLSDEIVAFGVAAHKRRGADIAWLSLLRRFVTRRGVDDRCYLRDELSRLEPPARFIWGEHDAFASPDSGRRACAMMRDAHIEVLSDAGHLPQLDAPEACARALRRAVRSMGQPTNSLPRPKAARHE